MSLLAFFILLFGLIATMIAATINGLVLPNFASKYWINDIDVSVLNKIIGYGHAINISMTYIVITAISLSIGIWSFLIIKTNQLSKWLGYFGLTIIAIGHFGVLLSFDFTSLLGFRTFIFSLISWIIVIGIKMTHFHQAKNNDPESEPDIQDNRVLNRPTEIKSSHQQRFCVRRGVRLRMKLFY